MTYKFSELPQWAQDKIADSGFNPIGVIQLTGTIFAKYVPSSNYAKLGLVKLSSITGHEITLADLT